MRITGGCHCGAIRYQVEGDLIVHALCHCSDCRRHAGAPMVGWAMYPENAVRVTQGEPKIYASSEDGRRHFCANCGTGLFYVNDANLPGIIDLQSGTFDHITVTENLLGGFGYTVAIVGATNRTISPSTVESFRRSCRAAS